MPRRHVHLLVSAMMLAHVVLHDCVATGKTVLVAKALEDALCRVPLVPPSRQDHPAATVI